MAITLEEIAWMISGKLETIEDTNAEDKKKRFQVKLTDGSKELATIRIVTIMAEYYRARMFGGSVQEAREKLADLLRGNGIKFGITSLSEQDGFFRIPWTLAAEPASETERSKLKR